MHLITGLIVASLLKRRGEDKRPAVLRLTHPVRTRHLLPGRVRFEVPSLAGDDAGSRRLAQSLSGIDGVECAQASPITGSVLVEHDDDQVSAELLWAAVVRLLGLDDEVGRPPECRLRQEIRAMGRSLNAVVYDQTGGVVDLWTAVPIAIGLYGAYQIARAGQVQTPPGFTMMWWTYLALLGREHR
ncbi:MAG: hypothetical protein GF320_21405 [Armatimonadia bacterium]|nr:hypothetical protein [Armatimonadia bacterium]